jgi:prepilin-type N-terminal cleavage/methylation domain-containing protein
MELPSSHGRKNRRISLATAAFTLVEIMIVVAVIALLAALAIPSFLRARKRSQAVQVKNDLRLIDDAVAQYATDTSKSSGDPVAVYDWLDYIKDGTNLAETAQDIFGNDYGDQTVDSLPNVPASTWDALSDDVDANFWSPYVRDSTAATSSTPVASSTPKPRHKKRRRWG